MERAFEEDTNNIRNFNFDTGDDYIDITVGTLYRQHVLFTSDGLKAAIESLRALKTPDG